MKAKIYIGISLVATLVLVGCSSKTVEKPINEPSALIEKHKELPSWVNSEDKSLYSGVGSARFTGQTYTQQKSEAQLLASAELAEKIEKRIDVLMKSYHESTGQGDAVLEDVFKKTASSIASQTISGIVVKDVYISKDGEMFIRVEVDPKYLSGVVQGSFKMNRTAWQQVQASKAFKELEKEAKAYREQRDSVPNEVISSDLNTSTGA